MNLMGCKSSSELLKIQTTPDNFHLSEDQEIRISLILDIHSSLKTIFQNPDNIYGIRRQLPWPVGVN